MRWHCPELHSHFIGAGTERSRWQRQAEPRVVAGRAGSLWSTSPGQGETRVTQERRPPGSLPKRHRHVASWPDLGFKGTIEWGAMRRINHRPRNDLAMSKSPRGERLARFSRSGTVAVLGAFIGMASIAVPAAHAGTLTAPKSRDSGARTRHEHRRPRSAAEREAQTRYSSAQSTRTSWAAVRDSSGLSSWLSARSPRG